MPRVHFVKKARKDNSAAKAGESYYWWKFRYRGRRPTRSWARYRMRRGRMTRLSQEELLEDPPEEVSANSVGVPVNSL